MPITSLKEFIALLRTEREICEVTAPVDPHLEVAEIHRRVIEQSGKALLFTNVKGADFPLVTNLFGTTKRVDLAFGSRPEALVKELASFPHTMLPPTLGKVWDKRKTFTDLIRVGLSTKRRAPRDIMFTTDPKLTRLPLLQLWPKDGGAFITLPLVYTEHPETRIHNLGMYRIQRYDDTTTGLHCQIGKGGGYHLHAAQELGQKLPVQISVGGPPALILSAIAPLPENVPELLFASFVMGSKLALSKHAHGPLPLMNDAELTLIGEVNPTEVRPEGPFGDHYGYYSLEHDYPVFHCKALAYRKDSVFPATVVGKPRQEDFYIGEYLQKMLAPLFPVVMPQVRDLWSYGETGFHSLSAAVVQERYARESLQSAFRILGEGQLSLTKFLLLVDRPMDLTSFTDVFEFILARANFTRDLYVFSRTSMDTLDYAGPKVNHGSKGVLIGCGAPVRDLPYEFSNTSLEAIPKGVRRVEVFCGGCLVIEGPSYEEEAEFVSRVIESPCFEQWPFVVVVDDAKVAVATEQSFLWNTFTRFDPASDIYARQTDYNKHTLAYTPPIVIDARMKPWYPDEVTPHPDTVRLVDRRWAEYFSS